MIRVLGFLIDDKLFRNFFIYIIKRSHDFSRAIGHFRKYYNTLCLSLQILHKHCFQLLLELIVVPRENKNNACMQNLEGKNKEYFGIFESGPFEINNCFQPKSYGMTIDTYSIDPTMQCLILQYLTTSRGTDTIWMRSPSSNALT